jgi:hypothetical protein
MIRDDVSECKYPIKLADAKSFLPSMSVTKVVYMNSIALAILIKIM